VLGDIHQLNGIARKENPNVPVVVMGHSMGSFFVQNLMFAHPEDLDAAVLSGTTGKPPAIAKIGIYVARLERKRVGARGTSGLLHEMGFGAFNKPFKPARTALDWLSRDPLEVDKYVADKRCGFVASTQLWIDLLGGLDFIAKPDNQRKIRKDLPVYIFSGARDPVGDMGKGPMSLIAAYRAAGLTNIEHKIYPDARHETLNETNRDDVVRDLLAFLERALAARVAKAA
jgi:alpha-beta hydrolase superfamily lysophospholipase